MAVNGNSYYFVDLSLERLFVDKGLAFRGEKFDRCRCKKFLNDPSSSKPRPLQQPVDCLRAACCA